MESTALLSKSNLSFAFCFGFIGGPLHARHFKRLMRLAGYEHEIDPKKADIIIAHSAGCWLIPNGCTPKIVMYIGMPLALTWPRQTFFKARQAVSKEGNKRLGIKLKNSYYALKLPRRNINIIRGARTRQPVILPKAVSIFIANRNDPWPVDKRLNTYLEEKAWKFINLPGSHDDLWQHSSSYIDIINYYARLLAKTNS
jgi:hypothetical protein